MRLAEMEDLWASLSPRQQEWVKNKQQWEQRSRLAILSEYQVPDDSKLTPCGCAACTGCSLCKEREDD